MVPQAVVIFGLATNPNVVDLLSPHPPVQFREVSFAEKAEIHEVNVAESLAVALTTSATRPSDQLPVDTVDQAALHSACNRSCAGNLWVQTMVEALQVCAQRIRDLVQRVPEHEMFKFGNGGRFGERRENSSTSYHGWSTFDINQHYILCVTWLFSP